ncbi:uncharacterized protein LOC134714241 [Mytilus trossulus]|uniref:uncharacterized protein LOC134714241 n=1 Tax=Mytilus trossulus TaxID=6551 RepID=UPI003006F042
MVYVLVRVSSCFLITVCSAVKFNDVSQLRQHAMDISNALSGTTGTGQINRTNDCAITWKFQGMLMGLEWKQIGTCIDQCTGESSTTINSSKGCAIEQCLDNLFLKLKKKDIQYYV